MAIRRTSTFRSATLRGGALLLFFAGVATTAAGGCAEQKRGIGEECLKDDDCLSGICAELVCAAAPTLLDGSPNYVDGGGGGGPGDAGEPDTNQGQDAGQDAGTDAGSDAGLDAPADAPGDVTSAG